MKVAGSAVRLTVYIVLIIMGVLAIVVPPALEDYWFEGDMQRDFEGIAEAFDNPFGREALLTMGVIGGAFNIAALALYTRRKKSGEKREGSAQPSALTVLGREGIADILVYGADILVCLILTGYAAQGDIFPYDTLNKLAVALALLGAFGCLVVLIALIAGRVSAADAEHVKASPSAAKSGSGQPAARAAAPAAQPPAGEGPRTSVAAAPVAPVGRQVPVAPAPRAEQSAPVRPAAPVQQPQMQIPYVERRVPSTQPAVSAETPAPQVPVQHAAQAPVQPQAPVRPAPQAPVQPVVQAPVQPAPQAPVQPAAQAPYPARPAAPAPGARDAYGGWYDNFGGYHDVYGGYYDPYGGYHAADGNYYPPRR